MQPFATQLGRAGGVAGGLGGGLLGSLGQLLEPLDYPRQALWNLGGSLGKAVTGQGEWDDVLRAVPGAAGVIAGGLTLPFGGGLPAALGVSNLVSGITQGFGRQTDPDKFKAPDVSDLTGSENPLLNMAVGAATDPMSFGGFLGGAKLGKMGGSALGGVADTAAAARGPQYAGGLEKLHAATFSSPAYRAQMAAEAAQGKTHLMDHLANIRANPEVMAELAPGSQYLGSGVESMAFRTPEGGVVRFRRNNPKFTGQYAPGLEGVPATPQIEEMLQPVRSRSYGGDNPLRAEHVPFAETIPSSLGRADTINYRFGGGESANVARGQMIHALKGEGYHVPDLHFGNLGEAFGGGVKSIDPGAVWGGAKPLPLGPEVTGGGQGGFGNWLLDMLGGSEAYQKQLAHMTTDPTAYSQAAERALAAKPSGYLPARPQPALPPTVNMAPQVAPVMPHPNAPALPKWPPGPGDPSLQSSLVDAVNDVLRNMKPPGPNVPPLNPAISLPAQPRFDQLEELLRPMIPTSSGFRPHAPSGTHTLTDMERLSRLLRGSGSGSSSGLSSF